MRLCIGTDAARRCAERAPRRWWPQMRELVAAEPAGDEQAADAYERLWALVVGGADNLAYQLALNSLLAAVAAVRPARPFAARGARP